MNKFKLKAVAVAISLVAAGGANAAINGGKFLDGNNDGKGELYFSVFDAVNQISYTRDLGVTIDQFLAGQNGTYNFAADARLTDFINTANTSNSTLVWNLMGAMESDFADPADWSRWGLYVTSNSGELAVNNVSYEQANIATGQSALFVQGINGDAHNAGIGSGYTVYSENNSATSTSGFGYYGGPVGGSNIGNSVVINDEAVIGQSMEFFHVGLAMDANGDPVLDEFDNTTASHTKFAGKWTLASNGDMSYSAAVVPPPVPLPPAVLLLGSALAGLVGIARRKRTEDEIENGAQFA